MTALDIAPRLLVVEDDADLLSIVQDALEEEGYGVTPATSLPDSLSALEARLFHFVLTDLFAQRSQAPLQSIQPLLQEAAPIPVGVLTAWPIPEDAVAEAHLAFLLQKPFDIDDLLRHMDAHIHAHARSPRQRHLVQEFFLALNAHDWTRLERLCTPEVRVTPPLAASSVSLRLHTYLEMLEQRWSRLPGYTIEEAKVFGWQDELAARYIASWADHDGIVHRVAGAMRFRFQHGRISQIEGAF